MDKKIVIATNNLGKIQELSGWLKSLPVIVVPQSEFHIGEAEETGLTFLENALIKARYAAKLTGLPAIADDSGLVVPYLKGEPGIYSARYAGMKADARDNINKLLMALTGTTKKERHAWFHCSLVYLAHANDPTPIVSEGRWDGYIIETLKGDKGFGYDPIFYDEREKKTAAELSIEKKLKVSHRGKALNILVKKLLEEI